MSKRALGALLAVLGLTLAVAACGSSSGSSTTNSSGGASGKSTPAASGALIQKDPANASKTFTVGSKNFDEEFILGEIYAQSLEAAGFKVSKQLDLGSEQIAYKALRSGDVDAYPEYSGTALTNFYKVKVDAIPRDKDKSYQLLKQDAAKDGVTALPQTPYQNTFVVTSNQATAKKYGNPKTLSEVAAKAGSKGSISGFPECRQRTDCLVGLKNVYKWTPKFVSSQGKYADLDAKQADFTFGFGTDGEQLLSKYVHYADDKQLFPPYYISLLTRNAAVAKLGKSGLAVIAKVQQPLTEKVMAELNSRVSIDKQKPE
ncbi:MAG: glycine betaine ABC transporter substrate-binding protein, partial [Solirubrobacteraceae bacterium]